jgi:hypothetical protein
MLQTNILNFHKFTTFVTWKMQNVSHVICGQFRNTMYRRNEFQLLFVVKANFVL